MHFLNLENTWPIEKPLGFSLMQGGINNQVWKVEMAEGQSYGSTYCAHFPLNEEELLAMPDVFQLRDATSFVYRMGRYLAGRETDERMQGRVKHSLWREEWLVHNREKLVRHVLGYRRNVI